VAPQSGAEEIVSTIWAQVLDLKQVSIEDNFFELGGHSLSATRVVHLIREAFRIDLPLRSIFEAPTIAELSLIVEDIIIAEVELN
jgi:acyl carrier protein